MIRWRIDTEDGRVLYVYAPSEIDAVARYGEPGSFKVTKAGRWSKNQIVGDPNPPAPPVGRDS